MSSTRGLSAVTRRDVARLAGVSASTVSYVLSGERAISAATKARVEQAIEELGYTPNAFARGLAGSRGGIVALHYPHSAHGLSSTEFEYVWAATARARQRGYHLLLWSNSIDDIDGLGSLISQRLVDGVILMEVRTVDPRISILKKHRVPFATIGRPEDADGVAFVDDDFESLGEQAVEHVAGLGHRHVVFLSQPLVTLERGYGPIVRTTKALQAAATRYGIDLTIINAEDTVKGGHYAFAQLAASVPQPTAVISFNESATPGLVHAAALAGVAIPADLTVVAVALGHAAADMLTPPLTTVSPPSAVLATKAMDLLADLIEEKAVEQLQELVLPTLTVRESSAVPRTSE